jgi:hypothetical protein
VSSSNLLAVAFVSAFVGAGLASLSLARPSDIGWCAERFPNSLDVAAGAMLPELLELVDVNGDGRLDLLFNGQAAGVRLALAAPGSGFLPARTLIDVDSANLLATGDLTGDGNVDLVLRAASGGNARVYVGDGKGGFAYWTVYSMSSVTPPSLSDLALGDVDGDGAPDLLAVDQSTRELCVRLNVNGGIFGPPSFHSLPGYPGQFELGDVDLDGDLDLVAHGAGQSARIGVMLGDGAGNFAPAIVTSITAYPFVLRDIDGDGKLDIAVATGFQGAGGLRVFLGTGNGAFNLASGNPIGAELLYLALGDFDGDGKCDAAVADVFRSTWLLKGLGAGTFEPAQRLAMPGTWGGLRAGDVDGDGYEDLASLGNASAGVWFGTPTQTLARPLDLPLAGAANAMASCDFDGDTHVDLVLGREHGAQWMLELLRGDSRGGLSASSSALLAARPEFVTTADFDGDGSLDALCASKSGARVDFVRGTAGGGFAAAASLVAGGAYSALAAADVDGDGFDDVLVLLEGQNTLQVVNGSASLPPNVASIPLPAVAVALDAGDVDGDGRDDALVALADGSVVWLRGSSAGLVAGGVYSSSRTLLSLDVAHLDADGFADVALGTFEGGLVAYYGGPTGLGPMSPLGPVAEVARAQGLDLDSDGYVDLVYQVGLGDRSAIGVRRGSAAGFLEGTYYSFTDGSGARAFADLDGDGWAEAICAEPAQAVLRISRRRKGARFEAYCPAGVSVAGCRARLSGVGEPSVIAGSGLSLVTSELDGLRSTVTFLSTSHPLVQPWAPTSTSFLCTTPPVLRASVQLSSGSAGQCNGAVSIDASALVAAAAWLPGTLVFAQTWFRDPLAPKASHLSNAISFELTP